ncbi:MAG: prephenate dehydrogenase [Tissierellia bacterium]|nr:prephenate dehydrogenase [Tissierellia bacterium]
MNVLNISDLNISIVGLGLIGGSIAKSIIKNYKPKNLWAIDINLNTLNKAKYEGVINEGYVEPIYPLINSDIVIFCTYPNITINFIKNNMDYFKPNSLLTDTAGVKSKIITEINKIIRNDIEFIGGHPMSGKESMGYEFSRDNMFEGGEYILTPCYNTKDKSLNLLTDIIKGIGFKIVTIMTPEEHDERIAFTSQLPHIIACTVMNNKQFNGKINCIGGSIKDITRIADINNELWSELIVENKNNILNEMKNFINDINNIYDIIKNEETEQLKLLFKKSCHRRKEMIT